MKALAMTTVAPPATVAAHSRSSASLKELGRIKLLDFFVYSAILLFVTFDFVLSFQEDMSFLVQLQFFLIEILTVVFFIMDRKLYSIHKFLMLYMFVFEGYAPLQQYRAGSNLWSLVLNTDELYIYSNLLVFLFLLVFELAYRTLRAQRTGRRKKITDLAQRRHLLRDGFSLHSGALIFYMLLDVVMVGYLTTTGQLMGKVLTDNAIATNTITAAFKIVVQVLCCTNLLVYVLMQRIDKVLASSFVQTLFKVVSAISIGLIFFPLWGSVSRFLLFAVYIILIVLLFPEPKHPSLMLLAVFLGFVFVFPAFNFFKTHDFSEIAQFQFSSGNFNQYDFDAHQCFMITIDYVASRGYSWGMNIFTAIFCFVPRSIWSAKWQPSGQVIFTAYGANWTNVSCPIYAEFYLAFGVIGLVIFAVLLALAVHYVESASARGSLYAQGSNVILIGMSIYITRGAMLPAFAYTFSIIIALTLSYFFAWSGSCRNSSRLTETQISRTGY